MTLAAKLTYSEFGPSVLTTKAHENLSSPHAIIRRHYFCQFRATLLDSADDREDAVAAPGRNASRLEHVHALFPGSAALRLRLRAACFTLAAEAAVARSTRNSLSRVYQPADRALVIMGQLGATERQSFAVGVGVSSGFGWPAVLHRLE